MRKPLIVCLLLIALMIPAILLLWSTGDTRWMPPPPQRPDASLFDPISLDRPALPPEAYSEQIARPLFVADRRPPPPEEREPDAPVAAVNPFEDVTVLGLFHATDGRAGVLLRKGGDPVQRIGVGERWQSWRLVQVEDRYAVFTGPGGQHRLEIRHLPQRSAPAQSRGREAVQALESTPESVATEPVDALREAPVDPDDPALGLPPDQLPPAWQRARGG